MEKEEYNLLIEMHKEIQEIKKLVEQQNNCTTDEFVDVETICRCFKISKKTICRYRQQELIPFHRIKGKVYFIEAEVKEALKRHYYGSKSSK